MDEITTYLIEKYKFKPIKKFVSKKDELDFEKHDCILRVGDIHYLVYSETYKMFSIGLKLSHPKGQAGGGYKYWEYIMIPKIIKSKASVDLLLLGVVEFETLHLYPM